MLPVFSTKTKSDHSLRYVVLLRRRSTDSRSPTPNTSGRPSSARRATAADDQTLCEYPRLTPHPPCCSACSLGSYPTLCTRAARWRSLRRSAAISGRLPATRFSAETKDLLSSLSSDPALPQAPEGLEETSTPAPTAPPSRCARWATLACSITQLYIIRPPLRLLTLIFCWVSFFFLIYSYTWLTAGFSSVNAIHCGASPLPHPPPR